MAAGSETNDNRQLLERVVLLAVVVVMLGLLFASGIGQDIPLYHRYAELLVHATHGDRLPVEYPALSALVFAAPLALPLPYTLGFSLLMAATLAGLIGLAVALGCDLGWVRRMLCYLGLGSIMILFGRYDLVPALATFLAVRQAQRGRWQSAWIAALAGGALKLFPFLLLPGFVLAEWRNEGRLPWKRIGGSLAGLAAFVALQGALVPGSLLTPLRYEVNRGFEISSLPATLTLLTAPAHLSWRYGFGTWQLVGAHHGAILLGLGLAEVAALALLWLATFRGRLSVAEVSLAVLTVAILADRVFSPQYLIWLAPLWALWPTRRSWLAAAALTTLTFPVGFALAHVLTHSFLLDASIGAVRNLVLLAGSLAWLVERLRLNRPTTLADLVIGEESGPSDEAMEFLLSQQRIEGGRPFVLDER